MTTTGRGGWMYNLINPGGRNPGGSITFSFLLQTGKVVEELLQFKCKY